MYRSSGETKDLAIDPEELLAAQKRATKKRLIALAVAVVVLGAAGAAAVAVMQSRARAAKQQAWDRFVTCLVGGPLAGEKPSVRVRNTQLVVMSVPPEKRTSPTENAWPARCAPLSHAVREVIKGAGGESPLVDSTEKLAKAMALDTGASIDLAPLVDKVFADAAAENLVAAKAEGVSGPPDPATPMTLATLPPAAKMFGGPLALTSIRPAPFGETTMHLLVDDKDFAMGPVLCSLAPGKTELACKKIPAPAAQLSPGLRLWGTNAEGVAPHVFAGERGKTGIFASGTGARVVDKLEYGAYGATTLGDGSLGYLVWNDKPAETHFVRVAPDGAKKESKVVLRTESGNPYYATSIFWDVVAYKSARKDVDGIRLMVRPIERSGDLGKPIDVGRIDEVGHIEGGSEEEPHLTACRANETTVIRAKGWDNTFVSFFVAGRWTAPVESQGLRGHLQCRSGEAIITRVWGGPSVGRFKGGIVQSRCTVSGCNAREVDVNEMMGDTVDVLPRALKDIRAVDLDGKLLVVWSAGDRGGLRMRLAPADQIASAPDTILFEDHLHEGAYRVESTLVDFQLVPVPGAALLLMGTVDGVYAHLVDASGKLQPVATKL
ncbi:MAG: hypothetical protein KF819_11700 [Labilithrix sp.]|nr:hypothetical protein [Labilithrix sp.]